MPARAGQAGPRAPGTLGPAGSPTLLFTVKACDQTAQMSRLTEDVELAVIRGSSAFRDSRGKLDDGAQLPCRVSAWMGET